MPSLRPGQVVVLENLSVHKSPRARALIEAAGCRLLFLPRYSPDVYSIEPAFAKVKQALRPAAVRTFAALAVAECRGFYAAAGFPLPGQLLQEPLKPPRSRRCLAVTPPQPP